jgi:adenylosuccinate synthase
LDTFETIKIAIAYKVDGQELESYPADLEILERAEVVYHEMPGWQTPTTNAKSYYDLPKKARDYVEVRMKIGLIWRTTVLTSNSTLRSLSELRYVGTHAVTVGNC